MLCQNQMHLWDVDFWLPLSKDSNEIKTTKAHLLSPRRSFEHPSFHFGSTGCLSPKPGTSEQSFRFCPPLLQKAISSLFLSPGQMQPFHGISLLICLHLMQPHHISYVEIINRKKKTKNPYTIASHLYKPTKTFNANFSFKFLFPYGQN